MAYQSLRHQDFIKAMKNCYLKNFLCVIGCKWKYSFSKQHMTHTGQIRACFSVQVSMFFSKCLWLNTRLCIITEPIGFIWNELILKNQPKVLFDTYSQWLYRQFRSWSIAETWMNIAFWLMKTRALTFTKKVQLNPSNNTPWRGSHHILVQTTILSDKHIKMWL